LLLGLNHTIFLWFKQAFDCKLQSNTSAIRFGFSGSEEIVMANAETDGNVRLERGAAKGHNAKIVLILFTVFLFWISLYAYLPTLPVVVKSKVENLPSVGFILATFGVWQLIIRLPLGITSDWLGRRKPFILVGLIISGVGAWIMGQSEDAYGLAVGRSLTGIAASTWVTMVVIFNGFFPPEDVVRATSMLTLANSAGRMLATSTTGTLNELGGYSLAFKVAAGAAMVAFLAMLFVQEKCLTVKATSGKDILNLILRSDVLLPSLLNMLRQYVIWGITFSFIPILASQLGATNIQLSALTSMNLAIGIAGTLFATFAAKKVGSRSLIYASIILMGGAIGLATIASSLALIFISQFCNGLASGIGYPVLLGCSIEHVREEEQATAMGLHQAVYAIGMSLGPWLCGIVAEWIGIQPMFAATAVGYLGLSLLGASKLKRGDVLETT
jgi:MFS family permease